jgi:hypothetical protein
MKMLTAGTLAGTQELLASWLAKDRNKHGNYFTSRVPKMAAYGALVSAPLGHFLIWLLQKTFRGRTSLRAKILQILVSNLIVSRPCSAIKVSPCLTVGRLPGIDCSDPELGIPGGYGLDCRCPNLPPGPRHRTCRLHEGHESIVDHLSSLPSIRPAVPT